MFHQLDMGGLPLSDLWQSIIMTWGLDTRYDHHKEDFATGNKKLNDANLNKIVKWTKTYDNMLKSLGSNIFASRVSANRVSSSAPSTPTNVNPKPSIAGVGAPRHGDGLP